MSNDHGSDGQARACRDRCEVCDAVLLQRPVANRRRCGDHLDQLALVPVTALRRPGRKSGGKGR
jgi:hypothetical protein